MRLRVLSLAVVAAMVTPAVAQKVEPFQVKVFVTGIPQAVSPEGFVDASNKWVDDSVADIKKALDNKPFHPTKGYPGSPAIYHVVASPDEADVVATVVARGVSAQAYGQRTTMQFYRGVVLADTIPNIGVTRWVSMVLSVGTYRKEITAWSANRSRFSAGTWSKDAKILALEVAGWVMANEDQIKARRSGEEK